MDTSNWRIRVLMEPRGFIRVIEVFLAIVAFATTGGYSGVDKYSIACNTTTSVIVDLPISYPFRLYENTVQVPNCSAGTSVPVNIDGDLSPSAEWFLFVGTTAFLISLASVVFYVVFDATIRQTNERLVTIGDLVVTVIYAFLWLTAASAWAWGLGQVKLWSGSLTRYEPLASQCSQTGSTSDIVCGLTSSANFSPLNASVAFGFLNFFLWTCNVWFVYKESPYHEEPNRTDNTQQQPPPSNI